METQSTLKTGAIFALLIFVFSVLALSSKGDELPRTAFSFTAEDFDRDIDGDELSSLAETIPVGLFERRFGLGFGSCADGSCAAPMAAREMHKTRTRSLSVESAMHSGDSVSRRFFFRNRGRLFGRLRGFFARRVDRIHQRRNH